MKALNLLRVVAHTSWGADQHTLLHLYRSLVRSKLDYGSVVYGSTRESYLRILIRYRTMHCGYASVPSEPHLPQTKFLGVIFDHKLTFLKTVLYAGFNTVFNARFKTINLHSTYGEECLVYNIPSDLAHPEQSTIQYGLQRKIQRFLLLKT